MKKSVVLFLYILLVFETYSQEVSSFLTPNQIMIGDHMELILRAKNAKGITFPTISDSTIGNFRFVEELKTDTLYSGNDFTISKKYIITCFEDSIQIFPQLTFFTQTFLPIQSQSFKVTVVSPNVDSAKDIRPIKKIILVPLSRSEIASYLFVSLILLGFVLALYLVYIRWIRKEKLFDTEKKADPPHVSALSALKLIENEQLWQKGNHKDYYDRISDTIRLYLEKRFGIKALEQTTPLILDSVYKLELPSETTEHIQGLLELADLAKFAKQSPDQESNERILRHAYNIVQSTQMSYDANKKANAKMVRKFYGQNKYAFKKEAINQDSIRAMVFGLMATMLLLSVTIISAYYVPVPYLLGLVADKPLVFFVWFIIIGILLTVIITSLIRSSMSEMLVIFDYNSIIIRNRKGQFIIPFEHIKMANINKKEDFDLTDIADKKHTISHKIEYFDEIKERVWDIIEIEQNTSTIKQ